MINDHEDISKASFRRVNSKTLDHLFLSQVEKGANCPPFVSSAILDVAKRVYHLHSSTESQEQFKPGQYQVIGILSSEPAGKALEECRKGQSGFVSIKEDDLDRNRCLWVGNRVGYSPMHNKKGVRLLA